MRFLSLLAALLLTLPARAASTVILPVQVPLSSLQQAANAGVPRELARLDQTQALLGGAVRVKVTGTVLRSAQVSVKADGDALLLSVPIQARLRAESGTLAGGRDFGGAAVVTLRLRPDLTPEWQLGVKATASHRWTDPLAVDLGNGMKLSVQALADAQLKTQLQRLTARIEAAVRENAHLRPRAEALWAAVQQPQRLPTPAPAYALVRPLNLGVTPPRLSAEAIKLDVGASFDLSAALGPPPAAPRPTPLPALGVGPQPPAQAELSVPITLPYAELSALATRYAASQTLTLKVPTQPTLRVTAVRVTPGGSRLRVTLTSELSGPLGLRVKAITDVTGLPTLSPDRRLATLRDVQVQTRREGLSSTVIAWLTDARAQAFLTRAARFDLTPYLQKSAAQVQAKLPYSPAPGLKLSGQVGALRVSQLRVQPGALVITAEASGQLRAEVDAAALTPP